MQLLEQLRGINTDRLDMDEAILMLSVSKNMQSTYTAVAAEAPEWLNESIEALKKEVAARYRDNLERELKDIDAREETLKTASEKRDDLRAKRARVLAALGRQNTPASVTPRD